MINIVKDKPDKKALALFKKQFCIDRSFFPYKVYDNELSILCTEVINNRVIKEIEFLSKKQVSTIISNKEDIFTLIQSYYGIVSEDILPNNNKRIRKIKKYDNEGNLILHPIGNNYDVVNIIDSILEDAVIEKATDIHIEPLTTDISVRFRIDGDLIKHSEIQRKYYSGILTRIKVVAMMDISIKYLCQEGKFTKKIQGENIDFRVSCLPTINGEKIVLRLLYRDYNLLSLDNIGFENQDLNLIKSIVCNKQGLILITGSTGSGKTTTMYSLINYINNQDKNIIAIEDPVEYIVEGVSQVNINPSLNMTYGKILRASLRQDPDILIIGEINDEDTAAIAVRAALTGHLVLSTIHTSCAIEAKNRLIDMGIEPYLVKDSLTLIVAQRLVKLLCPHCKQCCNTTSYEKGILGIKEHINIYKKSNKGCSHCNFSGYKGRKMIYEFILPGINNNSVFGEKLVDKLKTLVLKGDTSIEEFIYNVQVNDYLEGFQAYGKI